MATREMRLMVAANWIQYMPKLRELGFAVEAGDTRIIWDSENEVEVANARRSFEELVGRQGYAAFAVKGDGEKGRQIRQFDPNTEKLILAPAIAGG
jgi:hypothetical protein